MWTPNQGHWRRKSQRAAEMTRAARCWVQLCRVQYRARARTKKPQARGEFFKNGASDGGGEYRVVPCGEPGGDMLGPDTHAIHSGLEGVQGVAWKFVGVFLAGKALFLV